MSAVRTPHHSPRLALLWSALLLALVLSAAGCGGGGGSTPNPVPTTGTISGKITIDGSLPTLPDGEGSRASVRVIDPQDIIASATPPMALSATGEFTVSGIAGRVSPYYLQIILTADTDLRTVTADTTPVMLNVPIQINADSTTGLNVTLARGSNMGHQVGIELRADYLGTGGARDSATLVNYTNNTISVDLNGDGSFDDDFSPDIDNDAIGEDRNSYDANPGGFTHIEREGALQMVANDTVTVGGVTFRIGNTTNLFDKETDEPLKLSDFNIGDPVNASGYMYPGGGDTYALRLRREAKLDDDDPVDPLPGQREVEREGILLAKTAATATVGDLTFQITGNTLIEVKDTKEPTTLAEIPLGACVDIKGNRTEAGIIATRVRHDLTCEDGGGEFELEVEGRIEAIDSNSITVQGHTFTVLPPIPVTNKDTGQAYPYASLKVGDFVKVEGLQGAETLTATSIRFDPDEDGGGGVEIEREGVVEAITASTITVQNTTFTVNAATEIVIKDTDEPIELSEIMIGEDCDVKGIQNGGTLTATRIRVDRE